MSPLTRSSSSGPAIGLLEWPWLNDYEPVEAMIDDIRRLGVRHVRFGFSWADYLTDEGANWYDWLIPRLARETELLPCFVYTPPSLGEVPTTSAPPRKTKDYADFIDHCISRYGRYFDTVELWNEPNNAREWDHELDPLWDKFASMIKGAAYWAHRRGKRTVLGGMSPIDPNWLHTMQRHSVLEHMDVIGLHGFPGSYDSDQWTWTEHLQRIRAQLEHYGVDARLWITETGYPTWRHNEFHQLKVFADLHDLPVERVYWLCLNDLSPERPSLAGLHVDPRDYHFGIKTAAGREKLLYRAWSERGLEGVRAMARWADTPCEAPSTRPMLITGGAGFVGANLAARLADEGRHVRIFDNLARPGVEKNLEWLRGRGGAIEFVPGDVRDPLAVGRAMEGVVQIFHLAAQVAVTTSLADPREDFEINLAGTLNVLEAARRQPMVPGIVFSSTNKVYGALADIELEETQTRYGPRDAHFAAHGIDENRPLAFASPYGCSKGGADQYILDFAHSFGIPAAVFRMSCIYGPRQFGTEDQGWVAHFMIRARDGDPITIYGDGKQVRDILFVDDLVDAFLLAETHITELAGQAFNIGGGASNAISLLELIALIAEVSGRRPRLDFGDWRTCDQPYYVSSSAKFLSATGWRPQVGIHAGVSRLYGWLNQMRPATEKLRQAVQGVTAR